MSGGAPAEAELPWHRAYAGVPVLVLGATGFIGSRVVRALATRGALVTAVTRNAAALDTARSRLRVEVAVCDVARVYDVAALVRRVEPAVTFNLAGYGVDRAERDARIAYRINAELPALLAQVVPPRSPAGWQGHALVHAGSALEYGQASGDLHEDTRPVATTLYGRSKLQGTLAIAEHCRSSGVRAVTARLFTVYGPGEHAGRLLPVLLETSRTHAPLDLTDGSQQRDFTFVDDVAEGMLRLGAAVAERGEVVNLATGRLESVRSFALRAAAVLGIDAALLRFGALPMRPEEMVHEAVSVQRLRALTGWMPATSIDEGVRLTQLEMSRREAVL